MVPARPLLQGQTGLGAVKRLDLAFLVDRQNDGMGCRIDVALPPTPDAGLRLADFPHDRVGADPVVGAQIRPSGTLSIID